MTCCIGMGCIGMGCVGMGCVGMGCVGMGCVGMGCVGCTGVWTGFRVCPELFRTTIALIIVRDSIVRTFLHFINFSVLLFVFSRRPVLVLPISPPSCSFVRSSVFAGKTSVSVVARQSKNRKPWAETSPWGKTLLLAASGHLPD
jgi:hypothetical protein